MSNDDPLAALREHVRSAQDAAERLAQEAAGARLAAAGGGEGAPPSGWAAPDDERTNGELRALADLVESLRKMLPVELHEQLNELIRQILLLLRAVIDWLVARMERDGRGREVEVEVEDIPISY